MNVFKTTLAVVLALSIIGCASQPIGTTVTFPTASVGLGTEVKIVNQKGEKITIIDFGSSGSTRKIEKKF